MSWLLASGANPRAVQELARHSDLKLTTKTYCSTELLPTRQSLLGLPPMKRAETSDGPGPEAPASGPNAGLSCGLNLNPVALISTQTSESVSKVFDSVREKEGCLKSLSDQTLKQPFSPKELVGARGFEPPASCTPCKRASQAALRPDSCFINPLQINLPCLCIISTGSCYGNRDNPRFSAA